MAVKLALAGAKLDGVSRRIRTDSPAVEANESAAVRNVPAARSQAHDFRMADDHPLFGHSGGGLFCAYALLARPSGFTRYLCGSPSLAAGDYEVFRMEERLAHQNKGLVASVFFGAGGAELTAIGMAVRPQRGPAGFGSGTRRNSAVPAMSSCTDSTLPDPPIRNVTGTGGSTGVSNLARNDSR